MTLTPARFNPNLSASQPGAITLARKFFARWRAPVRNRSHGMVTPIWLITAVAGALGALAAIGWFVDPAIARAAAALPLNTVAFFRFITRFGESDYLLIVCGTIIASLLLAVHLSIRRRFILLAEVMCTRATFLFVVIAFSGIVAQLIKHLVGRARPGLMPQLGAFHFDLFSFRASLASFPSGHATTAFAMATALSLVAPVWALPLFAFATLIAASRMAIGAHYLSDVLAGSGLGIVCTIVIAQAFARRGLVFRDGALMPRGRRLIVAILSRVWSRET